MKSIEKTAQTLLDDLYTLGYWMTRSDGEAQELVQSAYRHAAENRDETSLLKAFRHCYVERFGQEADGCLNQNGCKSNLELVAPLKEWAADIRFSVLLREVSGLDHRQIAEIVGKPLETVRLWLFWGRKVIADDTRLKVSA